MGHSKFEDSLVSDLYKDAHGFRPGTTFICHWDDSSEEERQRIWDNLVEICRENERRDDMLRDRAINDLDRLLDNARQNGESELRVLEELADKHNCFYRETIDVDGLEYYLGLPCGHLQKKINALGLSLVGR